MPQPLKYSPPRSQFRWWIIIVIAFPIVLLIGFVTIKSIVYRVHHSGRQRVVTIAFVDAKTGLALDSLLDSSISTNDSPNDVEEEGNLTATRITWTDYADLRITVSVQGYASTTIVLNSRSPSSMTIPLTKK